MKSPLSPSPRAVLIAALIALPVTTAAIAQTAAAPVQPKLVDTVPAKPARPDQAIQRIRTEDAGTRIDEVRVGGQTQSIVVQPKTGTALPAYEVNSADTARGVAPSSANSDTLGARVWNVLKF